MISAADMDRERGVAEAGHPHSERAQCGLPERAICQRRRAAAPPLRRPGMSPDDYFPPPGFTRLCIAKQNSRPASSSAALRPWPPHEGAAAGPGRLRLWQEIAREGRDGRSRLQRKDPHMTHDTLFPGFDADADTEHHAASPTRTSSTTSNSTVTAPA